MERKLNIIDCPGSDDFCGSLFSAFKVGDVGVMVFNAQNGWEVGSEIRRLFARTVETRSSASSTSSTPRRPTSRGRSRASAPHRA